MRNFLGNIFAAAGFLGCCFFGYRYFQDTTNLDAFGYNITINSGDYAPILLSGVIMLVGILTVKREKR